jgi:hypothetical protein
VIDQRSPEDRDKIAQCLRKISAAVEEHGELGIIALALAGIVTQLQNGE